jgi:beta-glucosidase
MSDWAATMSGPPSVLAGLDMTMPGDVTFDSGTTYFGQNLVNEVNNGTISAARVVDMATRILTPWFLLGQNQNFPPPNLNFVNLTESKKVNVQANHHILIRDIGAQSNVLLKNTNNALPFSSSPGLDGSNGIGTFAIIGSDAGPASSGPNGVGACADHGCVDGTLAQGWGSGTTNFPYLITPLEAIQAQARQNGQTLETSLYNWNIPLAQEIAAAADVAIVFSLADSGEGYITFDTNFGDRNNLSLWNNGDALIEAVAAVNPNTIVVIHAVGPVLMPWINNPNVTAVVLAGLPGQESGNSLVDVLFGAVNPSGKLVYTIAKNASDYPAQVIYTSEFPSGNISVDYTEGLFIDYRWFDQMNIVPTFEFGFGLSYTTFTYSNIQISTPQLNNATNVVTVTATITNSGSVYGAEVVQLYLGFPANVGEPPRILRGFTKLFLNAGQAQTATFNLAQLDLAIWDVVAQNWTVPAGQFTAYVAASSRLLHLSGTFTISANTTVTGYATPTPPPSSPVGGSSPNTTTGAATSAGQATTGGTSDASASFVPSIVLLCTLLAAFALLF